MGILERKYCEFFVFKHHGHICVRETFDPEKFNEIMGDMTWFWGNYIADELLKKEMFLDGPCNVCNGLTVVSCHRPNSYTGLLIHMVVK